MCCIPLAGGSPGDLWGPSGVPGAPCVPWGPLRVSAGSGWRCPATSWASPEAQPGSAAQRRHGEAGGEPAASGLLLSGGVCSCPPEATRALHPLHRKDTLTAACSL